MSVISNTIQIFTAVSKSLTAGAGTDILYWSVIHLNIKCSKCISRKRKWKDGWTLVDNIYYFWKQLLIFYWIKLLSSDWTDWSVIRAWHLEMFVFCDNSYNPLSRDFDTKVDTKVWVNLVKRLK